MKFQQYTAIPNNLKKYMGLQGNLCNENWDPAMRTGVPCNKNRFFSLRELTYRELVPC